MPRDSSAILDGLFYQAAACLNLYAEVAELADAQASEACARKGVGVQIPPSAPNFLAILAVMKKGGDDRRPLRPICSTIVPRFGKNSLQLSRVGRLS